MEIIEVEGLEKHYEGFKAVDGLDFSVKEGEIFGIVGPNGAGKTTTIKMLTGLINPTSGSIRMNELDMEKHSNDIKKILGFLPEESSLYEDMTAKDYLIFFSQIYNVDKKTAIQRIDRTLDNLDMKFKDKKIGEMSKGMRRKVAIARSLINDPKILIYDEPSSGLDPLTSRFIIDFIKEVKGKKTILLSTHNLYHAEEICDKIMILKDGKDVASGTVEMLKKKFGKDEFIIWFKCQDEFRCTEAIKNKFGIDKKNGYYKARSSTLEEINLLAKALLAQGGQIVRIDSQKVNIEEAFLQAMK